MTINEKPGDTPSAPAGSPTGPPRVGKVRWAIAVVLGSGILINYIDRLSLSIVATPMMREFDISATTFGLIGSAFLWSYAVMQLPGGLLIDRIGVKWIWRVAMAIWAIASFVTALASGVWVVIAARVLLGAAEGPAMPGAMKATGQWFPTHERGLSTAIFDAGTRLANVVGLPLIAFTVATWGWREAFWLQGALSILFLIGFAVFYRGPKEMRSSGRLTDREYDYIVAGGGSAEETKPPGDLATLGYLLRQRKVWGLSLGLAGAGYVIWMLFTWLPGYLQKALDQTVMQSGLYAAIPGLTMFVAELAIGGVLVDRLITRGYASDRVRKATIIGGMLLAFLTVGAATTNDPSVAIVWIALGSAGIALVYVTSNTIPALIAPAGSAGTVAAIMNCVNLLSGVAAPIVTGLIVDATGSFQYAFIVGGVALVGGLLSYVFLMGRIEPIPERAAA